MKKLTINDTDFDIPSNWNELSTDQLIILSGLIQKKLSPFEIKVKMLFCCMDVHVGRKKMGQIYSLNRKGFKVHLTAEEVCDLSQLFNFLFLESNDEYELISKLTRQHFPKLPCGCFKSLIGPEEVLVNLIYDQAIEAEQQAFLYKETGDIQHFYKFIACLYPINGKYDPNKIDEISQYVAKTSMNVLYVIYLFWIGCYTKLQETYPECFTSGDGSGSGKSTPFKIHRELIYQLAKGDITKEKEVENSEFHRVLDNTCKAIKESEKLKEELKKNGHFDKNK